MEATDKDIHRWSVVVWFQCVALAVGMIVANYISGKLGALILAIDLALIVAMYFTEWRYRWRAIFTLVSILVFHLAVLMKPEDQPTVHLQIAFFGLFVWIVSLFIPRSSPRT